MAHHPGREIKGYEIVERIGSGGFGAVYRAYQTTLGREVAVKVILPGLANQPEFIRRFETEAQLVARLEHLHIVPLYDYWRDPDGAYLVMRWLRGGSLKDALDAGPYELGPAARLLDQVASGLAAAHAANVIHRDIKPSNLLLDEEGNAYLADFGIAKDIERAGGDEAWGEAVIGSPSYLAPEQARREPATPRTDIYSLGVTLYEILAGRHPFPDVTTVARLYKHINDLLPPLEMLDPGVQEAVNEVIQRATAKDPRRRYENVLDMAAAFRRAARLEQEGQTALVESLTLREQEVLQFILQGRSNREIADALFIELTTVKWYVRQIYRKLGARNRRQAILRARELDFLIAGEDEEPAAAGGSSISLMLPAPVNPFKGLRPFETADARDFFGREALIRKLLSRLSNHDNGSGVGAAQRISDANGHAGHRFLAIIGPSGSGKSSLVHAGLVPALGRGEAPGSERWFVVQMTPGVRPLDELEVGLLRVAAGRPGDLRAQLERNEHGLLRAAELILPRDGSELVLVIDQFEELFTLTHEESARKHFLDILSAAVLDPRSRVRLIITLRADYYDRPLHYPRFGDLVRRNMETLLPLSGEELERAIVGPAAQAGVTCEPGLAAAIIDDVLYQPGGLPLLQYALTELFEQRQERTLRIETYQAIGGVTGALARRAESLYLEQDAAGRETIRQLFLRLVAVDEEGERPPDTRRRIPRAELLGVTDDDDLMDEIVDTYAAYRLLTLDHEPAGRRPTVEVAHEALLREWAQLREWLEDGREDLFQHRRFQLLCKEWLDSNRDAGLLLREKRLDHFAAWAAESEIALTRNEQAFLDAGLAARQERRRAEDARRTRELETARQLAETERQRAEIQTEAARRIRRRAILLGAALVVAALLALAALVAGRQATLNAAQAQRNAAAAGTQEALTAIEAAAASTAEAEANLQRGIAEGERDIAEAAAVAAANAGATAQAEAAFRATAEAVAILEQEAAAAQARQATARELSLAALNVLETDPQLSVLLAMEAISRTYAVDGFALPEAQSALHQALFSLRLEQQLPGSDAEACQLEVWCSDVAYSRDGALLAAAGPGNAAIIWVAPGGEQRLILDGHAEPVTAVAFSPDAGRLATASADGTTLIWDIAQAGPGNTLTQPALTLSGHTAEVTDVTFSPDGAQVATAGRDDNIIIWDAQSGQALSTLTGHEDSVRDVAFSPDGAELFSAGSDMTARIWDVAAGAERLTLEGHTDRITDLALTPDGARLATASWDGTVKVWDAVSGAEVMSLPGDQARVYAVAFSPDGTQLAAGGTDAVINIWDAESGEELLALPGHQGIVHNLAFSPDGSRLASGAGDGDVLVWDLSPAANREWLTLDGHNWVMFGVDFSPDGSRLATASWDGAVKLWDVQTGAEISTLLADDWRKFSVLFSPDGRQVASSALNDSAVLWDVESGEALHTFGGHLGPILDVAFSPDGRLLATVGEGGETPGLINLWDTVSGELVRSWTGHDASIERAAISPDGRLLATAGTDGAAKLWLLDSGELIAELPDHQAPVNAVNFSQDGRYLGTAGADNVARIWEIAGDSVTEVAELHGHSSVVWDVVFSPDDTLVATIGFDEAVRLWDWRNGVELLTLPGAANNGREVAFSPDGRLLAVSTSTGLVRVYVVPVEELMALAASRLRRSLTDEECRQYLHVEQCRDDG